MGRMARSQLLTASHSTHGEPVSRPWLRPFWFPDPIISLSQRGLLSLWRLRGPRGSEDENGVWQPLKLVLSVEYFATKVLTRSVRNFDQTKTDLRGDCFACNSPFVFGALSSKPSYFLFAESVTPPRIGAQWIALRVIPNFPFRTEPC